jgi:hypothetical protein
VQTTLRYVNVTERDKREAIAAVFGGSWQSLTVTKRDRG